MCGIVGYFGEEQAAEKIYRGLKRLEYRGYDSAGIATAGNPSIKVEKGEGTIDEVSEAEIDGTTGVGHTRWATHGGVNDRNAHPHTDCEEEIAVVHNGIINNHEDLKGKLIENGHEFHSETDTEVVPHMLEEKIREGLSLKEALMDVEERLDGSYAIAVVLKSGEMAAVKQDSPLAIGVNGDERFLASDVTPFLEHTSEAIFLEDGDVVVLNGKMEIFNQREKVEREVQEVDWDAEQASKEGHEHFMQKEIKEQPKTVKKASFQDKSDLEEAVEMLDDAEEIYLTGCGTASFAASLGAKYLEDAGYNVRTEQAHELEYSSENISEDDLVIAVSQSGETADLLSLLDESPAPTLAVVNAVGSTLARQADHTMYINAGPEIGVASTKAFTSQLGVLKLLQYASEGKIEEGREKLLETAEAVEEVLEKNEDTIESISDYFTDKEHAYFIGRDKGREMADEAALKLKELSYIHAEAFPGGEFKHGTLALVEEGTPVIAFLKDNGYDEIISNAAEARSRGADLIGVGKKEVGSFKHFIEIPDKGVEEIVEVAPFQMIAYLTSVELGHNPDKPRNLAKSVTVK